MKILFVGDVFSKLGRKALESNLKRIKENEFRGIYRFLYPQPKIYHKRK